MHVTTQQHPFNLARRAARLAMAHTTPEYAPVPGKPEWHREPTGRIRWGRRIRALSDVAKRLASILDQAGITSRKVRGSVRAQLPAAYPTLPRLAVDKPATLRDKLHRKLIRRALVNSSSLPAGGESKHFSVIDRNPAERLALVRGSWWYKYSNRHGSREHEVAILTGHEDGQDWARRVPPSCATVAEALAYVRPAEVNVAMAEGREVRRQGDVWLIQMKRGTSNLDALRGTDHRLDGTRLVHPQHGAVDLGNGAWKAFLSKDTTRAMVSAAKYD